MVDVTGKDATKRTAVAAGTLRTRADVVELIATGGLPKGDALATARVAGILAAKRTSDLIPLCHQLALTGVDVDFDIGEAEVGITATVRSTDRTGTFMRSMSEASSRYRLFADTFSAFKLCSNCCRICTSVPRRLSSAHN